VPLHRWPDRLYAGLARPMPKQAGLFSPKGLLARPKHDTGMIQTGLSPFSAGPGHARGGLNIVGHVPAHLSCTIFLGLCTRREV
jgi:hypothetical protein